MANTELDACKQYVVSYNHGNSKWGLVIWARDEADCKRRMYAISMGTVDGELMMTIPGELGWLAKVVVWVRNLFAKLLA